MQSSHSLVSLNGVIPLEKHMFDSYHEKEVGEDSALSLIRYTIELLSQYGFKDRKKSDVFLYY